MIIEELGPWNLQDHLEESVITVGVLERIRCPECDRQARVGWKRVGGYSTEFYCVDCGYLGTFAGTFQVDTIAPSNISVSDHVGGIALAVQASLAEARLHQSAVDKLSRIAYDDAVAKLKPLIVRQDKLEEALAECAQRVHQDHHVKQTHIDEWRECWKPECKRMQALFAERVEIE